MESILAYTRFVAHDRSRQRCRMYGKGGKCAMCRIIIGNIKDKRSTGYFELDGVTVLGSMYRRRIRSTLGA
jgi:hypothetical protein